MNKIFALIEKERQRQLTGLELIPSENYVSEHVLQALGSILTNKYSEGFPGRRYYGGNEYIDEIERYAQRLANKLFQTEHAIVQPYSGSPANLAVDLALANVGDPIMGLSLTAGGHLTHGAAVSFTGKLFQSIQYGVGSDGRINMEEVRALALKYQPKIIWCGLTAYPYTLNFAAFSQIAEEVGAYLVADISHIAGLVIAGSHPSPTPYADVITTTTHKTLRGPRGAMILITKKGVKKDPDIIEKLERAVFPGLQGGPHNHQTAAIAVALEEATKPQFKRYIDQVVKNARVLAEHLNTDTENHLMVLNLSQWGFGLGYQAQLALETAGITVNKNTIPSEPASPFYPSGIRLGTPAVTTRGMKEKEMVQIAAWIKEVLLLIQDHDLPDQPEQRPEFIKQFKAWVATHPRLQELHQEISNFSAQYPYFSKF